MANNDFELPFTGEETKDLLISVQNIMSGATSVPLATSATNATNATNATKINNIEITKDLNGVLKIGNIIIPQKIVLWEGDENVPVFTNSNSFTDLNSLVIENVNYASGDTIEILSKLGGGNTYITTKIKYNGASAELNSITHCLIIGVTTIEIYNCNIVLRDDNTIGFLQPYMFKSESGVVSINNTNSFYILKISKIIE